MEDIPEEVDSSLPAMDSLAKELLVLDRSRRMPVVAVEVDNSPVQEVDSPACSSVITSISCTGGRVTFSGDFSMETGH